VLTRDRIRDWLEQADFNGDGCQHSYVTIGLAVGCSETQPALWSRDAKSTI
jgi:hypothetical protein